jgi:putative addiction module component (TIGR02574 family)
MRMRRIPFDINELTPDERIELAGQLWDSLPSAALAPDLEQVEELSRRRAELVADKQPGRPWREVLAELERDDAPGE